METLESGCQVFFSDSKLPVSGCQKDGETRDNMLTGSRKCNETYWIVYLVIAGMFFLTLMFIRSGTNPSFWFDESGQFWMSKGLNHFSLPFSPSGNLADTIRANSTMNMDPGGYTLGLRWWMSFSNSPTWLRLFSFSFFFITILAVAGTTYIWTENRLISLAAGLFVLSAPLITRYAFELRPYSMEACGVASVVLLIEYCALKSGIVRYLGLGLVCAVFLTSRYSFISAVIAIFIGVLWLVKSLPRKQRFTIITVFCMPVLISSLAIYIITLMHQNTSMQSPEYVQMWILRGKTKDQIVNIVAEAMFSSYGIGSTLFLGSFLYFYWRRIEASNYNRFKLYFIIVLTVHSVFIFLSVIGKYPLCPSARWGISQNIISVMSWIPLIWMISNALGITGRFGDSFFNKIVSLGSIFTVLYFSGLLHHDRRSIRIDDSLFDSQKYINGLAIFRSSGSVYANIMALGPDKFNGQLVFVSRYVQPTIRYLYEYGPLKQHAYGIYPDNFIFEDSNESKHKWEQFDYLLFEDSKEVINLQLGESKSLFSDINKYSESPILQRSAKK